VITAAFTRGQHPDTPPPEVGLVDELRASDAWLPAFSLVAINSAGDLIGHVVCTGARLDSAQVMGLGPLNVHPDQQRRGVGHALMHAVLGATDALNEPLVGLVGDPRYYPVWIPARGTSLRGRFAYAQPFNRV